MRWIRFFIIGLHLVWISTMMFTPFKLKSPPQKHLVVKTITPKVAAPVRVAASPPKPTPVPKAPARKPTAQPEIAKAQTKPKPSPKKPSASPSKPGKTAQKSPQKIKKPPSPSAPKESAVPLDLLRDLEESVAKIEQKRDKLYHKKTWQSPSPIGSLHVDIASPLDLIGAPLAEEYQERLVAALHEALHLPDVGEVKIQLVVRADGTVEKLSVLQFESVKNRKYLEAKLPTVKFPRFDKTLGEKKRETFTLTFCSQL